MENVLDSGFSGSWELPVDVCSKVWIKMSSQESKALCWELKLILMTEIQIKQ